MSASAPPPSATLVAGKYQLVREIGRGGMGSVWEAHHVTLGNRVAVKFIEASYADSPEARVRFDNEARAAANIQSKHAIQIFDHGVLEDRRPYIVMELLEGETLDRRLDRGPLSLGETARILLQVCRGLGRAHERGIIHRDLKPENIFLVRTPDDDDEIAKVLDFGIAKFKKMDGQAAGLTSSTKTGAVLGTPFYMAPEQARGLRDLDHRVDLWSLGVIAFKCVTGALPFEGVSVGDLLVKICTTPAPVPSSVVRTLPPAFDAWFARALEKDPVRRFQTAVELSDALANAAGVSVRHGVSFSAASDSGGVAATSMPPSHFGVSGVNAGASAANVTSAPFTASNPRTAPASRGLWFAAGAAILLGGTAVGGTIVYKLAKAGAESGVNDATHASATSSGESRPVVPPAVIGGPLAQAATPDAGPLLANDEHAEKSEKNEHGAEHPEHGDKGVKADAKGDKGPHHHPGLPPPGGKTGTTGSGTSNVAETIPSPNFVIVPAPPAARPTPTAKPTAAKQDELGY